tara:strand:+ start:88 stop:525 length:438 start_codon:yes stop_codon:yes gene_type:complete
MNKKSKNNHNKDFIKRFSYPGATLASLASVGYLIFLIILPFNSFFMGNFLTGVLTLAYLSGVVFCVFIKKDFFNGGGEGMFYLKTTVLLFIIPLVFVYNLSSSPSKGSPDLLRIDFQNGEKICVYSMDRVNAKQFGGNCPSYKNW